MVGVSVYGVVVNPSALSCLSVTIVCSVGGIDLL